jgi:hypothetical protein
LACCWLILFLTWEMVIDWLINQAHRAPASGPGRASQATAGMPLPPKGKRWRVPHQHDYGVRTTSVPTCAPR